MSLNNVVMQSVPQRGRRVGHVVMLVSEVYWRRSLTAQERDTITELRTRLERKELPRPGRTRRLLLGMFRDPLWQAQFDSLLRFVSA